MPLALIEAAIAEINRPPLDGLTAALMKTFMVAPFWARVSKTLSLVLVSEEAEESIP